MIDKYTCNARDDMNLNPLAPSSVYACSDGLAGTAGTVLTVAKRQGHRDNPGRGRRRYCSQLHQWQCAVAVGAAGAATRSNIFTLLKRIYAVCIGCKGLL